MIAVLDIGDFAAYFEEVHGVPPFPWQRRLAAEVAGTGRWPRILDLPTGSGKTATLDIALFHLALEAGNGPERRAPVRIAFVVDRRLIVDDAFGRAEGLQAALRDPAGRPTICRVAERLKLLSGDGPPLIARRLRGGLPREDDWARTPAQPTILCSTVDQVGSRLLFRGYGVSPRSMSIHAGLIGCDCLILLDEAHLAEPFRQTLEAVGRYRSDDWRERASASPWAFAQLSATPGSRPAGEVAWECFGLDDDDRADLTLSRRLSAAKPARLVTIPKTKRHAAEGAEPEQKDARPGRDAAARATALADEAISVLCDLKHRGLAAPAIGLVVNRVARARAVFEELRRRLDGQAKVILMIGPAREIDRKDLAGDLLPIRTGAKDRPAEPLVIVATQTIEAGVDIDLDGLISEAAPLDALRQRFGRLDRDGRLNADGRSLGGPRITPAAAVVAHPSDLAPRSEDAIYGGAIRRTWELLASVADQRGGTPVIDFGIERLSNLLTELPDDVLAPKPDAPVLMPAHLDLLSQTAPVPAADPEVALYLHGPRRESANLTLLWRADVDPAQAERTRDILALAPARSAEAIELPIWAVRVWIAELPMADDLADLAGTAPEEDRGRSAPQKGQVFRWAGGDDERSRWIQPWSIRPGDTLIVPSRYGGCDAFGWNPSLRLPVDDVADEAAEPFAGRRFAVRVAPGLLVDRPDDSSAEDGRQAASDQARLREAALAEALAGCRDRGWRGVLAAVLACDLPPSLRHRLRRLHSAKRQRVEVHFPYGDEEGGRPQGLVFVAMLGLKDHVADDIGGDAVTEDDAAGSAPGYSVPLVNHLGDVERRARAFAHLAGLDADRAEDLALAGLLHDIGKVDPRFQAMLAGGDILAMDAPMLLAKSTRPVGRDSGKLAGLPERWRHEALSVRLTQLHPRFAEAKDAGLVLWLIGTHHGLGRPLFPHHDPLDRTDRNDLPLVLGVPVSLPAGPGPQSLAFDWNGRDWPGLFEHLKERYGVWELARLEAILRLADHRASEESQRQAGAAPDVLSPVPAEEAAG